MEVNCFELTHGSKTNHAYLRSMERRRKYWQQHFCILSSLPVLLILEILITRPGGGNWPTLISVSFPLLGSAALNFMQFIYFEELVGYGSFISSSPTFFNDTQEHGTSSFFYRYPTNFLCDSPRPFQEFQEKLLVRGRGFCFWFFYFFVVLVFLCWGCGS